MKLLRILQEIMEQNKMVAIYADEGDHDYHYVGYIQAVDETGLLLSKQNYGGFSNGFVFFTDIIYAETDSIDTQRHEMLYQLRGNVPETFAVAGHDCLLDEILQTCYKKRLFCDIFKKEDDEGDTLGFITQLHEEYLVFTRVDKYGETMGTVYLDKSDIFRIFIEGEYEQACRLLYEDGLQHKEHS